MARQQNPEGSWYGRMNRLWIILAAIVVGVIVLAAFMSRRREVPVRAAKATRETITATIQTNGKIEPLSNFEAHAPAATTVKRVLVHEGQQVKAGQLLLELDDADFRSQEARARTQVRAAEADLNAVHHGGTREEVLTNESQLANRAGGAGCGAAQPGGDAGVAAARSSLGGRGGGCGKSPEDDAGPGFACWSRS